MVMHETREGHISLLVELSRRDACHSAKNLADDQLAKSKVFGRHMRGLDLSSNRVLFGTGLQEPHGLSMRMN